jgi:hypothetical protein
MSDDNRGNPNSPAQAPAAEAAGQPTYEMLWNCPHCRAQKLLGHTHRHCPQCGSPQDPAARYYPSDEDKVPVQNHVYVGADRVCSYCRANQSRNAKHCGNCGGPLDSARDVARIGEKITQEYVPADAHGADAAGPLGTSGDGPPEGGGAMGPPAGSKAQGPGGPGSGRSKRIGAVLVTALLVCGVVFAVLALVWKRDVVLEVAGHTWKREIDIERYGLMDESRWCDEVPSGVEVRRRHPEIRSKDKVKEGEDCTLRKVDNGDGTFREKRECKPRYVEKPVYADKCDYKTMQWKRLRSQVATGGLSEAPRWPDIRIDRPGNCDGCEREGLRHETYLVQLKNDADVSECSFDQSRWASMRVGSRWAGRMGRLTGTLDCSSLRSR